MIPQETVEMVPQTTTEMVATQVPRTIVEEVETYTQTFTRPGRTYETYGAPQQVGVVETFAEPTTYAAPVPTTYAAPRPTTYAAPIPTTYAAPTTYPAPVTPYGGSIIGTRY